MASCALSAAAQPYKDASLSPEARAKDLLSRLTLEEKVSLMQHTSPAIERLGIPQFNWWNEALHGVARNGVATVFPITMGMAASFDDAMVEQVFTAASDEARAKANIARKSGKIRQYQSLSFWTPNINIFRDPRWGRGQETYGEDPYLTSQMGLAVVRGLQGPEDTKYRKLFACAKHFAVHSGPEWNRHSFNAELIPNRDLWETYLPAFKTLVQEGKVREVMCAYNRFEGEPCCGSNRLLQQILRFEWGFKGIVTSDCWALSDFWQKGHHEYTATKEDGISKALIAGTDVECGSAYASLTDAVKNHQVSEAQIDISLLRLLEGRFELGDFDDESLVSWQNIGPEVINNAEHRQLALDIARESMVLLQNKKNVLPLKKDARVLVIGANANDSIMLWGNYSGKAAHTITILEGIKSKSQNVTYLRGSDLVKALNVKDDKDKEEVDYGHDTALKAKTEAGVENTKEEILEAVKNVDVVIYAGGISPRLEGEEMRVRYPGFRGGDRETIELPQLQRDMLKILHQTGKKVVFVNCSGSAMGLVPETETCDAILQAWYGGESGGAAVADVLFGDYNPAGKLPITFYKNTEQLPDFQDYTMKGRTYRYMKEQPQWAFGYGLSYTNFKFSAPSYKKDIVSVKVSNTGKRDGSEVVQVYIRKQGDAEGPNKALRAFKRVSIPAGKTVTVDIPMPRQNFEWWDENTNTMHVIDGAYDLMVGNSSNDSDLQTITVTI